MQQWKRARAIQAIRGAFFRRARRATGAGHSIPKKLLPGYGPLNESVKVFRLFGTRFHAFKWTAKSFLLFGIAIVSK